MNRFLFLVLVILFPLPSPAQTPAPTFNPKTIVYTCLFLPIVSTSSKISTWNFSNSFSLGFATGINVLFSERFGFSYDVSPVITTTNGNSRVSNFIFDPGPIFRFNNGFLLIARIAFETAGRFGESTVLTKVFTPQKKNSLFLALGVPLRFGNNLPPSIGVSVFFGIAFK
jgi:hypothetical protein